MFWAVLWPKLALRGERAGLCRDLHPEAGDPARLLGRDGRSSSASLATVFGAASSSCSYRVRSNRRTRLFRKGSTLPNAIIFEFASTNLVFELGLALLILLGWQFVAAEFAGGLVMVMLLALVFKVYGGYPTAHDDAARFRRIEASSGRSRATR